MCDVWDWGGELEERVKEDAFGFAFAFEEGEEERCVWAMERAAFVSRSEDFRPAISSPNRPIATASSPAFAIASFRCLLLSVIIRAWRSINTSISFFRAAFSSRTVASVRSSREERRRLVSSRVVLDSWVCRERIWALAVERERCRRWRVAEWVGVWGEEEESFWEGLRRAEFDAVRFL